MRISDDREGTGLGVQRQREDCKALVARREWTLAGEFVDNDMSAYGGKPRPDYEKMLSAMEAGSLDALVAWSSDRLTRHPKELERFIEVVEDAGVVVDTVTSGTYDVATPEGRAYARIVGAIARQESDRKSVRAKRKHLELAEAGKPSGGTRAFGYEDDMVTVRESEADLIREAASRLIAGESMGAVLRSWVDRGIKTVTGNDQWRTTVGKRMMASGRIAGLRYHRGERVGPATWPGIITVEQHEQLRAILLDPRRDKGRDTMRRRYLLTGGLLVCGRCEAAMVARPTADGRKKYVCAKGIDFKGCGRMACLAEPLDTEVRDQVLSVLDGDGLAEALRMNMSVEDDDADAHELAGARDRRDDLAAMYADGDLTKSEFLTARERITGKIETLEARLSRRDRSGVLASAQASTDSLRDLWASGDVLWRRALLKSVVESVRLDPAIRGRNFFDPDRVEVVWRS